MRIEVLIMLAVIGGLNVLGRMLAKRAEQRKNASLAEQAPARAEDAPRKVRAERRPVVPAAARVVAKASPAPAPVPVPKMAQAPSLGAPARPAPQPAAKAAPIRNRWNARSLRRAFIASEILGTPRSLRS